MLNPISALALVKSDESLSLPIYSVTLRCKKVMQTLPVEFTNKKISPWGGIHLLHSIYTKCEMKEFLNDLALPEPGSNRGYDSVDIIESFLVSVVLGAKRLAHCGMLRSDEVISEIFGWSKGSPSASTFCRFFKKFDKDLNADIFPQIQKKIFEQVRIKKMTIDIDSTVITRYGNQESAVKGYNPSKKGKHSHHPLMAFCADVNMVLNAWMRPGDSGDSKDMPEFLDELFEIVSKDKIGLIRMDSGFFSGKIMNKLESSDNPVNYIVKSKLNPKLKEKIHQIEDWHTADENSIYEYSEINYFGVRWKKERRMVVCRKKKYAREGMETQELFEEVLRNESYDYYAFTTNSDLPCKVVHGLYNDRGDCENIIKELKYDYSIEGFALQGYYPMEAAFRFTMLAYNLMVLFKQTVLTSKHSPRLSTMKFQCIALGSYVVKNGRNKMLKLSAAGKRRHFLAKIFEKVDLLPKNFAIP